MHEHVSSRKQQQQQQQQQQMVGSLNGYPSQQEQARVAAGAAGAVAADVIIGDRIGPSTLPQQEQQQEEGEGGQGAGAATAAAGADTGGGVVGLTREYETPGSSSSSGSYNVANDGSFSSYSGSFGRNSGSSGSSRGGVEMEGSGRWGPETDPQIDEHGKFPLSGSCLQVRLRGGFEAAFLYIPGG